MLTQTAYGLEEAVGMYHGCCLRSGCCIFTSNHYSKCTRQLN